MIDEFISYLEKAIIEYREGLDITEKLEYIETDWSEYEETEVITEYKNSSNEW